MKLNWYFWKIYLPIQILSLIAIVTGFYLSVDINWLAVFVAWFLIGPVGVGVGFHRLFSHRQFKTYRPIEYVLAFLGTLSTYAPVVFWVTEHQHHHKFVDQDIDVNSPKHGFWHSFLYWRFKKEALSAVYIKDRCSILALNDPMLKWMSNNFVLIIYSYMVSTMMLGLDYFLMLFVIPVFVEQLRINILNSVAHISIPGSYQNFPGKDSSHNHTILGWVTMGFGWHNNHHANPRELVNSHRWWEVDIEGQIGKFISKKT